MNHPFFQNIKLLYTYILAWIFISGIHVFLIYTYYLPNFFIALSDALVFNVLFAALGIPIWWTVRYFEPKKSKNFNIFFNNLTGIVVLILLWQSIGNTILNAIWNNNFEYLKTLEYSIPLRILSGVLYYSMLILVYYIIVYYNNIEERILNESKLQQSLKEAQLDLLKSQINPHFLFNSLNSISSLTITSPERAQEMTIRFSEFLRYNLSLKDNRFSTFKKEIENIHRYLEIEKCRFGEKLQYFFNIDDVCLKVDFPVMILQPLYENAVKHGVSSSTEEVKIITTCNCDENYLNISIKNNFDIDAVSKRGTGLGMNNINDRLNIIYPSNHKFESIKTETSFEVKISIPSTVD
jgi:sensor histidine kinase YesM